jgi:hypothetical protein
MTAPTPRRPGSPTEEHLLALGRQRARQLPKASPERVEAVAQILGPAIQQHLGPGSEEKPSAA